jgi:UDP-glucose 4-epimerase
VRALITGGAGFIGSHLAEWLCLAGHEVVALDDLSTGSRSNLDGLTGHGRFEFVPGSVLDADRVDALVAQADTVFHLAAAVGVKRVLDDPLGSLRTNLWGTENVLRSALRHGPCVLVASTSEVYGHNTADALHEDSLRILGSPTVSRWTYAEAKAIDEALAYAYWRHEGLPTVIVRPFNVVGPRQTGRYGMVVPRFVGQALRGEPLTVHGDGTQTRCFCHVSEAVAALVALVEHAGALGRVVNIGRPEEVSIGALARRVVELTGSASPVRLVPYGEAYEEGFEDMRRRVPDIGRARALIGFDPVMDLDTILRSVIGHETAGSPELTDAAMGVR